MRGGGRIACFVSPHGLGHAARASAVLLALRALRPEVESDIFTSAPEWFFADSLGGGFRYHEVESDIGLVQRDSLRADLDATVRRLDAFYPLREERVSGLAAEVRGLGCGVVLADIAPLGVAVARAAGLPSVLVENFTWDWIYEGYREAHAGVARHASHVAEVLAGADHHVQTEPVCRPVEGALRVAPISRPPRMSRDEVRRGLGVPDGMPVVLLTMGGVDWGYGFLGRLPSFGGAWFVVPGGAGKAERRENVVLLPKRSSWYHPDLVHAADAVVGKLGYSTLAEAFHAGVPFGHVGRTGFRESGVLERFVEREMRGDAVPAAEFETDEWLENLPELLALGRREGPAPDGAGDVAGLLAGILG